MKKLKQITSQLYLEDQSLDSFTSDYRKIQFFNWNPPVCDLLQALCTNDIDDQVELDEFQLVESYTQNDLTHNDTDHVLPSVDVTIQRSDYVMPVDGNIQVSFGQTLVNANTQTTVTSQSRDSDQVESEDSFNVETHYKHDNTHTDNDQVQYTVDATVRSPGLITPVDGNIRVLSVRTLTDASTQTTGFDCARDSDTVESDDSFNVETHSKHNNTNTDNDHVLYTVDATVQSPGLITPVDGNIRVLSVRTLTDASTQTTGFDHSQDLDTDRGLLPVDGNVKVTGNKGVQLPAHVPKGAAKVNELTLELFDNNFNLYAQEINHPEEGLFIRVILMKNNLIIFNYTYKINGTSNVAIATIASAEQVCNHYLVHAVKGDSFICALGDGHHGVRNPIIRNEHLANFIITLNAIKVKIGLYTIVTGLKSDWLQYASHNTIYQELSLAPDKKKTIIPTIESFLNDKWFKSWDDLAGHAQTKYWLPRPDAFLASKLLQMSRKHLGFNIQFFSGHGWWRKHLFTAKLSKSDKCRLCLEDQAVKTPIHIFSECPAMVGFRQVLFNYTYPSQHTRQQYLCQVTELALHGSVQELIERTDQYSYVHSME